MVLGCRTGGGGTIKGFLPARAPGATYLDASQCWQVGGLAGYWFIGWFPPLFFYEMLFFFIQFSLMMRSIVLWMCCWMSEILLLFVRFSYVLLFILPICFLFYPPFVLLFAPVIFCFCGFLRERSNDEGAGCDFCLCKRMIANGWVFGIFGILYIIRELKNKIFLCFYI